MLYAFDQCLQMNTTWKKNTQVIIFCALISFEIQNHHLKTLIPVNF